MVGVTESTVIEGIEERPADRWRKDQKISKIVHMKREMNRNNNEIGNDSNASCCTLAYFGPLK